MTTPARRQYLEIKAQHQDALLAYQVGDFYEFFDSDARIAAETLQIVLTARAYGSGEPVPLAGVPLHALETYLARLVAAGHRVAVCEQVSPPGRGLVARAVTRILSPGTVVSPGMLPPTRDNYLVAIASAAPRPHARARRGGATPALGLAYVEVSTGAFGCTEWPAEQAADALAAEVERLAPAEVLLAEPLAAVAEAVLGSAAQVLARYTQTLRPAHHFDPAGAHLRLTRRLGTPSLAGFGCEDRPLATAAAGAILAYVEQMNPALLPLLTALHTYETSGYVALDARTWRALEVVEAQSTSAPAARPRAAVPLTLLRLLDATRTPMGARLLRRTLLQPLRDRAALEARLDAVEELSTRAALREFVAASLGGLGDLERLVARVVQGAAVPREVYALVAALERVPELRRALGEARAGLLREAAAALDGCPEIVALVRRALADPTEGTGRLLRPGYNAELDALTTSARDARQWIAALEASERERTGIRSLKVGYNQVFGYYLEVTRPHAARVPPDYQRRQTLAGAERYVTPALKEHEVLVLHAEERIAALERSLYTEVLAEVARSAAALRATATALATCDLWLALAEVARQRGYTRPTLSDDTALEIEGGRHPLVEAALDGREFIANETTLGTGADADQPPRMLLLTGPNMAGKSTYLRQVATITLLAQVGSFVPARRARIGLVDRIFARVGAEDDLARGVSTFMLEMLETAYILRHASARSLIILDEVGRGTSTRDGLAIARAVVEHLRDVVRARTLFATHFTELAMLYADDPGLRSLRMAVAEQDGAAIFLHRVVPGVSEASYGVQVARMAGLPARVTERAASLVEECPPVVSRVAEAPAPYLASAPATEAASPATEPAASLEVTLALASLSIAAMTPIEAINVLFTLQQRALAALGTGGQGVRQ